MSEGHEGQHPGQVLYASPRANPRRIFLLVAALVVFTLLGLAAKLPAQSGVCTYPTTILGTVGCPVGSTSASCVNAGGQLTYTTTERNLLNTVALCRATVLTLPNSCTSGQFLVSNGSTSGCLTIASDPAAGTAGLRTLGTGAAQAMAGNDSRGADARVPAGPCGGDLSGAFPDCTVVDDSHAHTATTLPGATTTGAGLVELATDGESAVGLVPQANDSRLSDARAPTVHAHAAADVTSGLLSTARLGTGTANSSAYLRGDGAWTAPPFLSDSTLYAGSASQGGAATSVAAGSIANSSVNASAAIVESKLALDFSTHSNANDPTAGQKAALAGTDGVPGALNPFVTDTDARNADARTPTAHEASHRQGGGDPLGGTLAVAITGNSATSTAFAANPPPCSVGQYVTDIAADGTPTCAQVAYSQLSGAPAPGIVGTVGTSPDFVPVADSTGGSTLKASPIKISADGFLTFPSLGRVVASPGGVIRLWPGGESNDSGVNIGPSGNDPLSGRMVDATATTGSMWIILGRAGTAAAPTFSAYNDDDTGDYRSAPNVWTTSAGGTDSLRVTADRVTSLTGPVQRSCRATAPFACDAAAAGADYCDSTGASTFCDCLGSGWLNRWPTQVGSDCS